MRYRPTALCWIDPDVSRRPEWDAAQVRRLARQLGYVLLQPADDTLMPLVDQIRAADVDAVIAPAPDHFDVVGLYAVMCIVDVETACPRMSFARWATTVTGDTSGECPRMNEKDYRTT
ncbi:hypothetical protein [Nocardia sp. BMG51109]|uniref:hypothetical protein n=1 Tax=Nocardia sp. BMG51109 TaxID=1056816 RepID=UPI000462FE21|nr:hypothetical protein [Nocardia sp. BMG51109]